MISLKSNPWLINFDLYRLGEIRMNRTSDGHDYITQIRTLNSDALHSWYSMHDELKWESIGKALQVKAFCLHLSLHIG